MTAWSEGDGTLLRFNLVSQRAREILSTTEQLGAVCQNTFHNNPICNQKNDCQKEKQQHQKIIINVFSSTC